MKNQFKLLVFDWDGTLIDSISRIVHSFEAAASELDIESRADHEIKDVIGLGLNEAITGLYPEIDLETAQALASSYRVHFMERCQTPSPLFSGVRGMLQDLKSEGYHLTVATGKSRAGLMRALDETKCDGMFDVVRCADETCSKPNPMMLQEIMDFLVVDSGHTLMIGDSEYDLQMASNANTASLGVASGVHTQDRLLACEPLDCLETILDLPGWLAARVC